MSKNNPSRSRPTITLKAERCRNRTEGEQYDDC